MTYEEFARANAGRLPGLLTQAATLTGEVARWTASGFARVSDSVLEERLAICRDCPQWDASGFGGTGRCRLCGCSTAAKLRMATAECPEGRWKSKMKNEK